MQKSTTAPESAIAVVGDGGNLIARFATGFSENKLTALISVRRTEQTAILEVSGDIDLANLSEIRRVRNLAQIGYLAAVGVASFVGR